MSVPVLILHAEDDADDHLLVTRALGERSAGAALTHLRDGEELMDYLRGRGDWADAPRPALILLDLNMPRKGGREALREIKSDPELRSIPVVMLTTSDHPDDVQASYDLGVNAYLVKPSSLSELRKALHAAAAFWLDTARLPAVSA